WYIKGVDNAQSTMHDEDNPWQLFGEIKTCIFKGVHYHMTMLTDNGYELEVQDYHAFEPGSRVALLVKPEDIQVMKKTRLCNTFTGTMLENNQVEFLDEAWDVSERTAERFDVGEQVEIEVDFNHVNLQDDEDDGTLSGEVYFILYKGDHYHLQIRTDDGDDIYVDTNDIWDKGDRVGIKIAPSWIRLYKVEG
ncbi:MAG: TOBE domain-containing protein, partial [Paludibacteraceae bacterium]|nr:TOBE domain-containing protein [Paludibacteraceae bacterium]